MTDQVLVIDASALVALLGDSGAAGSWVAHAIEQAHLAAPELAVFEAANIFRRHENAGLIDQTNASLLHADLLALAIELWPYGPLADRAWQLRRNLTVYDGSYVALAELLGAPLVTLDARLARACGPKCSIRSYPG